MNGTIFRRDFYSRAYRHRSQSLTLYGASELRMAGAIANPDDAWYDRL